jgi:enediyne biosynthesis protein E4
MAVTFIVALAACSNKKEDASSPVFKLVDSTTSGISFNNNVEENWDKNYFDNFAYVYNGAGVAVGDINNDGLPDIYFTGNEVPNKLYLNEGGMKFKDITASAGVVVRVGIMA